MVLGGGFPFLTETMPALGGRIKDRCDDFVVEEIPLFEPSGEGEHLYVSITKREKTTLEVVGRLARHLGLPQDRIGFAGLKDRHAVATQILSVAGAEDGAVAGCEIPGVTVNWVRRHRHKLRAGALRGNRFRVVVRDLLRPDAQLISAAVEEIQRRGFPNYFGAQRFGARGDGHQVGRALVRSHWKEAVDLILGGPRASDGEEVRRARAAYEEGRFGEAAGLIRAGFGLEKALLRYLDRAGPRYDRAVGRIARTRKRLYLSAYQSHLFNLVAAERLRAGALDILWSGDVAMKHENGACFRVEDAAAEADRAQRFDVSPTGPIFGRKMLRPEGRQGEIEGAVLAADGVRLSDFRKVFPGLDLKGTRRALRMQADGLTWELDGTDLVLGFSLPSGSYATCFLRELIKPERL